MERDDGDDLLRGVDALGEFQQSWVSRHPVLPAVDHFGRYSNEGHIRLELELIVEGGGELEMLDDAISNALSDESSRRVITRKHWPIMPRCPLKRE